MITRLITKTGLKHEPLIQYYAPVQNAHRQAIGKRQRQTTKTWTLPAHFSSACSAVRLVHSTNVLGESQTHIPPEHHSILHAPQQSSGWACSLYVAKYRLLGSVRPSSPSAVDRGYSDDEVIAEIFIYISLNATISTAGNARDDLANGVATLSIDRESLGRDHANQRQKAREAEEEKERLRQTGEDLAAQKQQLERDQPDFDSPGG
ncbi:hypothetical protein F4819DRAFT_487571 [Hypoxylon fuscum]|nr:hypothetical protein F4819DRAFT_487571 [Hypoxylon fuscum]